MADIDIDAMRIALDNERLAQSREPSFEEMQASLTPSRRLQYAGKRAQVDTEPAYKAPLALARGWAAGTAGLPGDLEKLARMAGAVHSGAKKGTLYDETVDTTPVLPTSEFYKEWLPGKDTNPYASLLTDVGALTSGMGASQVGKAGVAAGKLVGRAGLESLHTGMQGEGLMGRVLSPAAPAYIMNPFGKKPTKPIVDEVNLSRRNLFRFPEVASTENKTLVPVPSSTVVPPVASTSVSPLSQTLTASTIGENPLVDMLTTLSNKPTSRREFLQQTGAVAARQLVPDILQPAVEGVVPLDAIATTLAAVPDDIAAKQIAEYAAKYFSDVGAAEKAHTVVFGESPIGKMGWKNAESMGDDIHDVWLGLEEGSAEKASDAAKAIGLDIESVAAATGLPSDTVKRLVGTDAGLLDQFAENGRSRSAMAQIMQDGREQEAARMTSLERMKFGKYADQAVKELGSDANDMDLLAVAYDHMRADFIRKERNIPKGNYLSQAMNERILPENMFDDILNQAGDYFVNDKLHRAVETAVRKSETRSAEPLAKAAAALANKPTSRREFLQQTGAATARQLIPEALTSAASLEQPMTAITNAAKKVAKIPFVRNLSIDQAITSSLKARMLEAINADPFPAVAGMYAMLRDQFTGRVSGALLANADKQYDRLLQITSRSEEYTDKNLKVMEGLQDFINTNLKKLPPREQHNLLTTIEEGLTPAELHQELSNNGMRLSNLKKGEPRPVSSQDLEDYLSQSSFHDEFTPRNKAEGGEVSQDAMRMAVWKHPVKRDVGGEAEPTLEEMQAALTPYVGNFYTGKRAKKDTVPAYKAPLALARGWAAGTAGLPGDLEQLARTVGAVHSGAKKGTLYDETVDTTPVLPTSEFYKEYLPFKDDNPYAKLLTDAGALTSGMGSSQVGKAGVAVGKLGAEAINAGMQGEGLMGKVLAPVAPMNVIKQKGGNWIAGSVDQMLDPLKTKTAGGMDPAEALRDMTKAYPPSHQNFLKNDPVMKGLERDAALNSFVDKQMTRYLKNEMSTPEDPIRLMAEAWPAQQAKLLESKQVQIDKAVSDMEKARQSRGFTPEMMTSSQARIRDLEKEKELIERQAGLHVNPEQLNIRLDMLDDLQYGQEILGKSPTAKAWEGASDLTVNSQIAKDYLDARSPTNAFFGRGDQLTATNKALKENPWLSKVDPMTPVYYQQGYVDDIKFDHIIDELRNATNPASGLPKSLQIEAKDLAKYSMPQAVERVDKINAWRASQKAEVDVVRANNAATVLHKDYPEKGMRWVELKAPKVTELPKGYEVRPVERDNGTWYAVYGPDNRSTGGVGRTAQEAIENENFGIRTLEDALKYEGEQLQHCVGGYCPDVISGKSQIFSLRDKGAPQVTIEVKPGSLSGKRSLDEWKASYAKNHGAEQVEPFLAEHPEIAEAFRPMIAQIKGANNRAPTEKYLPMVQDFIKSGKWSEIKDLKNAGMSHAGDGVYITDAEAALIKKEKGLKRGGVVSQDAMQFAVMDKQLRKRNG